MFEIAQASDGDVGFRSEVIRSSFSSAAVVAPATPEVLGEDGVEGIDQIRHLADAMDVSPRINLQKELITLVHR